jgi:hypothetical protein
LGIAPHANPTLTLQPFVPYNKKENEHAYPICGERLQHHNYKGGANDLTVYRMVKGVAVAPRPAGTRIVQGGAFFSPPELLALSIQD